MKVMGYDVTIDIDGVDSVVEVPFVARVPPSIGRSIFFCQIILPVDKFSADKTPH